MFAKMMIQKAVEFLTKKVDENNGKLTIDLKTCNDWLKENYPNYELTVSYGATDIQSTLNLHLIKKS